MDGDNPDATPDPMRSPAEQPEGALMIGYGTLLYRASLGDTIGYGTASEREMVPVLVRGFRRLFNLRPDHYQTSNVWGRPDIERGAMNVELAEGVQLNGLAFQVAPEELGELDRRERYYRRLEAEVVDFDTGVSLGIGQIYSSEPTARWIDRDPGNLMPLWRDIVWARAGAYAIGRRFGETFDQTTYLADGETLVVDRYADHLRRGEPPGSDELEGL